MVRAFALGLLTWLWVAGPAGAAAPEAVGVTAAPVEASSALWRGWEAADDHHPMFVADGDAKTGWAEGAEGDGVGEWLRLHVAPVGAVDRVVLAVKNGCQRTGGTWRDYSRVAKASVTLRPSGAAQVIELADEKGWQTFEVAQPAGPLAAVELRIEGVHRGGGDEHACLAEVAVRVPAGAVDPAREKSRAGALREWVKARAAVGKAFGRKKSREALPFAERYVARPDGGETGLDCGSDQVCFIEEGLRALQRGLGKEAPEVIERALLQMKEASGWAPVKVVVADGRPVPPIDGLCSQDGLDDWPCPQGVALPPSIGLLDAGQVQTTPVELIPSLRQLGDPRTCATYGIEEATFARPRVGTPAALVRVRCEKAADGGPSRSAMQLLVYGADGRLAAMASEREASVLSWVAGEKGARLAGARKLVIRNGERTVIEPFEAIE